MDSNKEYKDAIEVSIIFHEGNRMFAVPKQPAPVQEGWKLVPVKPTERMVEAGLKAFEKRATSPTRAAWKAMLSAAPEKGNTP
jgi:hypothetical protein